MKKVAILAFAILLGNLSIVPQGFAVAEYNANPFKIPAAIVTIIAGSFFPIYSVQLSLNAISCQKTELKNIDKDTQKVKQALLSLVNYNKSLSIKNKVGLQKGGAKSSQYYSNPLQNLSSLFQSFEIKKDCPVAQPSLRDRVIFYGSLIVGGPLTLNFLGTLTAYTFLKAKSQFDESSIVGGIVAGLVLGTSAYLIGRSIIKTIESSLQSTADIFQRKRQKPLAEKIAPTSTYILKATAFLVDALAVGPTAIVYGNAFNDCPYEKYYFQATMCFSVFLLLFTSTLDTTDNVIKSLFSKIGDNDTKSTINFAREHDSVAAFINASSSEEIVGILNKIPNETKNWALEINNLDDAFLKNSVQ